MNIADMMHSKNFLDRNHSRSFGLASYSSALQLLISGRSLFDVMEIDLLT